MTDTSPIIIDAEGPPRSRLYDDVYFSREDGLAESRAVFLAGCGLPERWDGRRLFTVAELGFGAGLNVLALLDLWRATRPEGAHLSIFSVEAHPIAADEAASVLAAWPELAPLAGLLVSRWPGRRPGFHRIDLPDLNATVDVAVMEAADALANWDGRADAWFLDGFSPAKNPAMWTPALMAEVARCSAPGAALATYTVAGHVRRALADAGFAVERKPGFGRKRQRLEAAILPHRRRGTPEGWRGYREGVRTAQGAPDPNHPPPEPNGVPPPPLRGPPPPAGEEAVAVIDAGFAVERKPGFGRKRQRLEASILPHRGRGTPEGWRGYRDGARTAQGAPDPNHPPPEPNGVLPPPLRGPPPPAGEDTVAIIGAGIGGAALARAFGAFGCGVKVFESAAPGAGASGNPAAVVTPRLDAGLGPGAQLFVQAFERATELFERLPQAILGRGALQLQIDPRDPGRFAKIAAGDLFEAGAVALQTTVQIAEALGEPAPAGLSFRDALIVDPAQVLDAWLPNLETAQIAGIEPSQSGWRLLAADGSLIAEADILCLAAGADLAGLWADAPVSPVRGQLSWVKGAAAPPAVSWGGYAAPMVGGLLFGATHDRGDAGSDHRPGDDQRNLAELAGRLPRLAARIAGRSIEGRASVRAVTGDNLPIAGALAPGLFVLGALGGRGFTLAPLLAEHIAALALDAPSPLPLAISRLLGPARFAEREHRRGRLAAKSEVL